MSKSSPGIASAYDAMSTLQVPQHWSPEQALAVYDFLNELAQYIWDRYEVPLRELIRPELDERDTSQLDLFDPNNNIPF